MKNILFIITILCTLCFGCYNQNVKVMGNETTEYEKYIVFVNKDKEYEIIGNRLEINCKRNIMNKNSKFYINLVSVLNIYLDDQKVFYKKFDNNEQIDIDIEKYYN